MASRLGLVGKLVVERVNFATANETQRQEAENFVGALVARIRDIFRAKRFDDGVVQRSCLGILQTLERR